MNAVMNSLKSLGSFRLMMLGLIGIVLIVTFIFLTTRLTSPVMGTLYSDLSAQDSQKIAAQLSGMGVEYEIRGGGSQIAVPADQVANLRMAMAGSGLPSQGSVVGYEIFDKTDAMGTSNFVQNVNLLRALEGELARTIGAMNIVENARVHLVIPKRELFVKDRNEPSAAVVLKLKGTTSISKSEIAAISHLVASSVPGLKSEKVTIVDSSGNLLSRGRGKDEIGSIASTNQEYQLGFENKLRNTIEELLERSLGTGKVKAQVAADIDFDRIITNSEEFNPDGQVARSIQTVEEKSQSSDKESQEVSVANNLPDAEQRGAGAGPSSNSNAEKIDETTNFEISKTVKNHVRETGTVKKLSVAVVVDGTYTEDAETKSAKYNPRSEEELEKIKSLVKSAIGFDEKRGDIVEVVNMQFSRDLDFGSEESPYEWLKRDLDSILKTVVIGVVAILVILLVIKPLVNRAFEISPSDIQEEPSSDATQNFDQQAQSSVSQEAASTIDTDKLQNRGITGSIRKINDVVSSNPEETLGVIRAWLTQK